MSRGPSLAASCYRGRIDPAAEAVAPSLDGEVLFKFFPVCEKDASGLDGAECRAAIINPPPRVTQVQCNPSGNTTVSFSIDGTAMGPYPGTFHESVNATIGAQVLSGLRTRRPTGLGF